MKKGIKDLKSYNFVCSMFNLIDWGRQRSGRECIRLVLINIFSTKEKSEKHGNRKEKAHKASLFIFQFKINSINMECPIKMIYVSIQKTEKASIGSRKKFNNFLSTVLFSVLEIPARRFIIQKQFK